MPMTKVAVVTDTTACIPADKIAEYAIEPVSLDIVFEGRTYRDGIDITPSQFYALLRQAKKPPTTAGALPAVFLEAYIKASQRTSRILCITISSGFSGVFNAALLAKELARESLPGVEIEVLDSGTAAAAQGLVVLAAARTLESGGDISQAVAAARRVMERVKLFASLDTLYYLVKGGRVPRAAALANSLLNIKPVFVLNHSDARNVALPRSTRGAMKSILKLMSQNAVNELPLHVAVMHADALDRAEALRAQIAARFDCQEIFITEFTPVMGVHTGPGLFGAAFYSGD